MKLYDSGKHDPTTSMLKISLRTQTLETDVSYYNINVFRRTSVTDKHIIRCCYMHHELALAMVTLCCNIITKWL